MQTVAKMCEKFMLFISYSIKYCIFADDIRFLFSRGHANSMLRQFLILILSSLLSVSVWADSGLPIIEIKADRTMIYPQRMELTGEESLMDMLQMVPDLMIAGYEDVISNYNLRIDN